MWPTSWSATASSAAFPTRPTAARRTPISPRPGSSGSTLCGATPSPSRRPFSTASATSRWSSCGISASCSSTGSAIKEVPDPVSFVTRLSLRLGAVVLLGVVILFGTGLFAATQVQQDLLPDISIPAVIVITPDPGASPGVADAQVTVPIVNAVEGVSGIDTVQSSSSQGSSLVAAFFKDGTDLRVAQQDVNAALARARPFLPPQTPASTVQTFTTNS